MSDKSTHRQGSAKLHGARCSQASTSDHQRRSQSSDPASHSVERRRKRRALISAPIRVRSIDETSGGPDEVSTTTDVSRYGVLFLTSNRSFHRGMGVAVTFPFTPSPGIPQLEQRAHVVRISARPDNKYAVALAFGVGMVQNPPDASAARLDAFASSDIRDFLGTDSDETQQRPLVLAVDADADARDSLKSYLTGEGYKIIAVATAADAREVLDIMTPALLIAEIEGDGLPGFDLCAHVKGNPRLKHIPVMLTTGSAFPSDYSNAHSLGAVVCMAKPYRQDRLGHVVRLLVAPAGMSRDSQPPRAPDLSRHHRRSADMRSNISLRNRSI